jgi:hypothetical protein
MNIKSCENFKLRRRFNFFHEKEKTFPLSSLDDYNVDEGIGTSGF